MGRRRRSLIAGTSRTRKAGEGPDDADEGENDDVTDAGVDDFALPEPVVAPPTEPAPLVPHPVVPPPSRAEAPAPEPRRHPPSPSLPPQEILETSYVSVSASQREDTTDSGWHDTSHGVAGEPLPPPPTPLGASRRGGPPVEPRPFSRAPESGRGGFREDDVATQRYAPEGATNPRDSGIGFGGLANFEDEDAPPTDEIPSAVLQDVSQPYSAPMSVPEPPPIPGILDRFTPAIAATRQAAAGKGEKKRPSYIDATPTPPPALRRAPTPIPVLRRGRKGEGDDGKAFLGGGTILIALLGIGGFALLLLGGVMIAWMIGGPGGGATVDDGPSPTQVEGPAGIKVKVQQGLRPGEPDPNALVVPEPQPEVAPVPTSDPVPTTAPGPRPLVPRPNPRPAPTPVPVDVPPVEAAQELGTLMIRSNRKVLVYVDGKAVGYTPKSYKAEPGARTVSAMLPGQPQSKQTQTVSLSAGGSAPVEFTF